MQETLNKMKEYVNKNRSKHDIILDKEVDNCNNIEFINPILISLLNSEIGEATQAMKYGEEATSITEELASCFVRLMNIINYHNIRISRLRINDIMKSSYNSTYFFQRIMYTISTLSNVINSMQKNGKPSENSVVTLGYCIINCSHLFVDTEEFFSTVDSVWERMNKHIQKTKAA